MENKILLKIILFPVILCLIHFFFVYTHSYTLLPNLDIPMHLLGGGVMAYSFILLLKKQGITINNKLDQILVVICFIGVISIFLEFTEFLLYSPYRMGKISLIGDTISDLFFGLCGGISISNFYNKI